MSKARRFRFALAPSRRLAGIVLAIHAAAAASAILVFDPPFGLALGLALAALGVLSARERALLRSHRSLRAIEVDENGTLHCERADGTRLSGMPGPRRHVSRIGVAMTLRCGAAIPLFVAADMLAPDDFRALRLWALWGRLPGGSTARQG